MDFGVDQGKRISIGVRRGSFETTGTVEDREKGAEEKKERKNEEKAKMKAERTKGMIDLESSSSSESSNSECDEVVDMSRLKESFGQQFTEEPQTTTPQTLITVEVVPTILPIAEENSTPRVSTEVLQLSDNGVHLATTTAKIEVCMGNKCKKSGGMELLAEFERVVCLEGALVGCKCLGKCKDGPIVRVLIFLDENHSIISVG